MARLARTPRTLAPNDAVIFETGYGPSGLPHIGTFGEVARTTMVRHAFRVLTDDKIKTRLIAFSDDMDALRKVPDNVPNRDMLAAHLGEPLSRVPDPFSNEYPSFGAANNARLRAFLDRFGFEYEFMSSTEKYLSGRFDATLLEMLAAYDRVMAIILPTLGPERRATYSPFLPISPRTHKVLQVPMVARDVAAGTVTYIDPDTNERIETPVTGGRVKCQWKADWAMRWVALGIDYEMAGKDLIDSVRLSSEICRALGRTPPESFIYELFLDEQGQKISKSKGNGLTIDEWLRYASPESLALFMYREPKAAKRLYFDVIPRQVDEYQQLLEGYRRQDSETAAVERGLARAFRQSAGVGDAGHLRDAADAGIIIQCRERRNPLGLHRPLSPRRHPADPSAARCAGGLRHPLLSAISCCRRKPTASRPRSSGWRSTICATRSAPCPPTPPPSKSRTWSTRSAGASRSST